MGVLIAVAVALSALFKYQENWIQYRVTSEQLKQEKFLFLTGSGPYGDSTKAFNTLVQRIEEIVSKEAGTWVEVNQQISKPSAGA